MRRRLWRWDQKPLVAGICGVLVGAGIFFQTPLVGIAVFAAGVASLALWYFD
jgi:hypothetical protein